LVKWNHPFTTEAVFFLNIVNIMTNQRHQFQVAAARTDMPQGMGCCIQAVIKPGLAHSGIAAPAGGISVCIFPKFCKIKYPFGPWADDNF